MQQSLESITYNSIRGSPALSASTVRPSPHPQDATPLPMAQYSCRNLPNVLYERSAASAKEARNALGSIRHVGAQRAVGQERPWDEQDLAVGEAVY